MVARTRQQQGECKLTNSSSTERLLVFARAPQLGRVKTRLCPPLNPEQALRLHRALVEDTLERLGNLPRAGLERWLYLSEALQSPDDLQVPPNWEQRLQEGDDLGARLKHAFGQAFDENVERVVVIGSDSPTVPIQCIDEAFDKLSRHDVVLGPALDGGYYLLGSSRLVPELFEHISWGSPTVLQETIEALQRSGASCSMLIEWYDIDTAEDLARLREEVTFISRNHPAQVPNRVVEALSDLADL